MSLDAGVLYAPVLYMFALSSNHGLMYQQCAHYNRSLIWCVCTKYRLVIFAHKRPYTITHKIRLPVPSGVERTNVGSILTAAVELVSLQRPLSISLRNLIDTSIRVRSDSRKRWRYLSICIILKRTKLVLSYLGQIGDSCHLTFCPLSILQRTKATFFHFRLHFFL